MRLPLLRIVNLKSSDAQPARGIVAATIPPMSKQLVAIWFQRRKNFQVAASPPDVRRRSRYILVV
jgi:hypothetical protein